MLKEERMNFKKTRRKMLALGSSPRVHQCCAKAAMLQEEETPAEEEKQEEDEKP